MPEAMEFVTVFLLLEANPLKKYSFTLSRQPGGNIGVLNY